MTVFRQIDVDFGLTLQDRGHEYRIEPPSAATGLRLQQLFASTESLSDTTKLAEMANLLGAELDQETDEYRGGVWSQIIDDGASFPELMRIGSTALLYYGRGPIPAAAYWGRPPNFKDAQAQTKPVKQAQGRKRKGRR
jgi:hypothetical protein